MAKKYILGVDLGQSSDYTGLILTERQPVFAGCYQSVLRDHYVVDEAVTVDHFAVRMCERLPLHTSYVKIAQTIKDVAAHAPGDIEIVVDRTGVGAPVCDLLKEIGVSYVGIVIHGGRKVTWDAEGYHVPKRDLVGAVATLLEEKRIKISPNLKDASVLNDELRNFTTKIRNSGHASYEAWRDSQHDDLVLALALAAWRGIQSRTNITDVQPGPQPGSKEWCENEVRLMREREEARNREE